MTFKKFLKFLSDNNYKNRKKALSYFVDHFNDNPSKRAEILNLVLVKKSFLIDEFWVTLKKLDYSESKKLIDFVNHQLWPFYSHYKGIHRLIDDYECKLFNENNQIYSIADYYFSFSKSVEIGKTNFQQQYLGALSQMDKGYISTFLLFPYSFHSFNCFNQFISRNIKVGKIQAEGSTGKLPYELAVYLDRIIQAEKDLEVLESMIDAWLYGNFYLDIKIEENKFKEILVKPINDQILKLARKNIAKTNYRSRHYEQQSVEIVSEDPHFQKIDPKIHTDKGLVTIILGPGIEMVEDNNNGSVVVHQNELFENGKEGNDLSFEKTYLSNLLNYKYRRNRQRSTFPADVEDIKNTKIPVDNEHSISLESVFKVIDIISAISEYEAITKSQQIFHTKNKTVQNCLEDNGLETITPQVLEEVDKYLYNHKNLSNDWYSCCLPEKDLIKIIQHFTKLDEAEIHSALKLIDFNQKNMNGFPSILFHEGTAYWKWQPFVKRSISRYLYDTYFLKQLYNGDNSDKRAKAYDKKLASYFQKAGFVAKSGFKYGNDIYELDVVAVKDGIVFLIESKMSNKNRNNLQTQFSWKERTIDGKGSKQIERALRYFSTEQGEQLLRTELGISNSELKLFPLIVSDNFYFDHISVKIDEKLSVDVISFFELYLFLNDLPLLNRNFVPERSYAPVTVSPDFPKEPIKVEPDESGNASLVIYADGRVEKNVPLPESLTKPTEAPEEDERKFQSWREEANGISSLKLIELIQKNQLWEFLEDELEGFQNKAGLESFIHDFRYDI